MKSGSIRNTVLLLLTAFIWGFAFVAQSVGMEHVGPFTFLCTRNILGGTVLLPVIGVMTAFKRRNDSAIAVAADKNLIIGGICCGIFLFMASILQQIGVMYTSVGKSGFLTAMYIILVPILGLLLGKKCHGRIWVCVGIAIVGLYLLCMKEDFSFGKGDMYLLACAALFAGHILVIDYFSPKVDGVKMACIQFYVCGILSGICALIFEQFVWADIAAAGAAILYAGVLSSGVAYTLQIVAQKNYNPTVASLLLSLESVFAVLGGWLILQQSLSIREVAGCVLLFIAIILAQL